MSRYIRKERLETAIISLSEWRAKAQSQASAHLFPFLSLIAKGATPNDWIRYEEYDDRDFFDKYFQVPGDKEHPYFDPLQRIRRVANHPHCNVSTARKNTFAPRWGAAEFKVEDGNWYWKLAPDYADTLQQKLMTKAGDITRPNVVDCAVWLFRAHEFPNNADAQTLQTRFRQQFPLPDHVYVQLFEFTDEAPANIYSDHPLTDDVRGIVTNLVLGQPKPRPSPPSGPETKSVLLEDDPILLEVESVLDIGSSGIIFRGCPGTGKTWYAWQVALKLTNDNSENILRVQFHSSFGYEDFVEGYRPTEERKSGFEIVDKTFLKAVEKARVTDHTVVFIIDEINRGDTSRIFGEVLTYIEDGWREVPFYTPYRAKETRIPRNLMVLATMNHHDRSITQLDMAMLRRFDHIDIYPSKDKVEDFLSDAGMPADKAAFVLRWFDELQSLLPFGIGHTYFLNVGDVGKLATVWRYRILPFCDNVLEFEPDRLQDVKRSFTALQRRLLGQTPKEE